MGGIFRLLSNGHAIIEIPPNSISFVSFLCFRKSLVDLRAFDEKKTGMFRKWTWLQEYLGSNTMEVFSL